MLSDADEISEEELKALCLNPCSAGLCSPTRLEGQKTGVTAEVLILVLLDYALRHN